MLEPVVDFIGSTVGAQPDPAAMVDRIAARERAIAALEAEQARDLAAFSGQRVAADQAAGVCPTI
jgi:hypothetical protein